MTNEECAVFASFVGKRVSLTVLSELSPAGYPGKGAYTDCTEYRLAYVDYYDKPQYRELFKLTPALIKHWHLRGIDFKLYIYAKAGVLLSGRIYKHMKASPHSQTGYATEPTLQELRITQRILSYITKEE